MKEHPDTAPEQKLNEGEQPIPDDEAAIAAVESARDRDADAYTEAIKRGDFFRDQLAEHVRRLPRLRRVLG